MGLIADRVANMRGCSLREIVDTIAAMEGDLPIETVDQFEEFWKAYPYKTAKPGAKKAYRTARRNGHRHKDIMYGLEVYIETKPRDRDWCMAATFLNQERFCDILAMKRTSQKGASVADLFGQMAETFDGRAREAEAGYGIQPPVRRLQDQR
jgi:hypothetical protein